MGPVQLLLDEGNLYQAWEKSRISNIDGFVGDRPGQKKQIETWICRPPNIMTFQLNRVNYDMHLQKEIKDNSKFEFEKEIYLDLFLNINMERSNKHRRQMDIYRNELKKLKEELLNLTANNDIVQKFEDCTEFMKQNIVNVSEATPGTPGTSGGPAMNNFF